MKINWDAHLSFPPHDITFIRPINNDFILLFEVNDVKSFEDKRAFSLEHTFILCMSGILSHLYF